MEKIQWGLLRGVLLVAFSIAGCAGSVDVRTRFVDPATSYERNLGSVLSSDRPSGTTLQELRLLNLLELYEEDVAVALREAELVYLREGGVRLATAIAELSLLEARAIRGEAPLEALGFYYLAATHALEGLLHQDLHAYDPRHNFLREIYNWSVARYVKILQDTGGVRDHEVSVCTRTIQVRIPQGLGFCDPTNFDEFIPSDEIEVTGFANHHRAHGIGAALTCIRENRRSSPLELHQPPEGVIYPSTAVLVPVAESGTEDHERAYLTFHNPRAGCAFEYQGQTLPLEADFTTPYGVLLSRAKLAQQGRDGFLRVEEALERTGLFMLEPYDPDKIPVVMVHGLRSSPAIWLHLTNDVLFGEPEVRTRYQVWHYMYPTGLPYLYSARVLRDRIEALRELLDPAGEHVASNHMVIVAHSMGGLLSKTLVSHSHSDLWNELFVVTPEELEGDDGDVQTLREVLHFEPRSYVKRIVFIATPHRGSDMANHWIGRLGSSLVRLPSRFTGVFKRITELNPGAVAEGMRRIIGREGPTSVDALAPASPLIRKFADSQIVVPYHTILGDRGLGGGELGSDGVVPYESAHLEGAVSELTVPAGHDVYRHPLAVREVRRILMDHLETLEGAE